MSAPTIEELLAALPERTILEVYRPGVQSAISIRRAGCASSLLSITPSTSIAMVDATPEAAALWLLEEVKGLPR